MLIGTEELQGNEPALVRAAQAGDRAAFGSLYRRYSRMVHGVLLTRANYADAEDLMQDVFVKAMSQLAALRDASALGPWLAAIARRAAFDWHRSPELTPLDDEKPGSHSPFDAQDEAQQALEAIRNLPAAYNETLMLRLVEGMTGPEIAARTGMTPESVRVNLCRGMKLLRTALEAKKP